MNFTKGFELLLINQETGLKISEIMLKREMELTQSTKEEIIGRLKNSLDIMKGAILKGISEEIKSVSGLTGGDAKKIINRKEREKPICGEIMAKAISYSMAVLEVNASMGKIVAAPTAGSSGILPGTLIAIAEEFSLDDEELINGLLTASAIGMIISRNATVAGAEGGCQAETGSAAAMAAAAIVELMGGSPKAALHGSAICLKNVMGLACDPIAGLVESPCGKRNAIGAANALISAEMALAGIESLVPFDEVVDAMLKVGKSLPFELRESGLGGLAATPTGLKIKKDIFG